MAEPAIAEAPECTPFDPAIVGPPAPDACDQPVAAVEAPYVYTGTGEPDPTAAFGHYAEDEEDEEVDVDEEEYDPMFGDGPEELPALTPEERAQVLAKPVDEMDETEFKQVLADGEMDPAKMQEMLDKMDPQTGSPQRKLELWKKLHVERNVVEMDEACSIEDSMMDPITNKERAVREATQDSTKEELQIETDALPEGYTMKDVNELIARKEKEHQIEQEYGINVTAQTELRADGTRVMWSSDELDAMKASLAQIPPELLDGEQIEMYEMHRTETLGGDHGDYSEGTIRIADSAANNTEYDARDTKSEEFEAEYGYDASFLEHVITHEIGHGAQGAAFANHEELWAKLPGDLKPAREYYAQDFKNAVINPEKFAEKSLDVPQENLAKAQEAYDLDPSDANRDALKTAKAEAEIYPQMYMNMRNNVFHTNDVEEEMVEELREKGYGEDYIRGFRVMAMRVSTPDQLAIEAQRYGYTDEHGNVD